MTTKPLVAPTSRVRRVFLSLLLLAWCLEGRADDKPAPSNTFLGFVRARAEGLRKDDRAPATLEEWEARKAAIRQGMLAAWGGFPAEPCPLEALVVGTIEREGYRVEKVVFQTRPGVLMTANAYVPAATGKHPAVLMVHGHWKGAKQDPVVQARCIGAVKLGFFVLAVDAFGAGERGVGKALGEYHGGMIGAMLLPVGLPLSGIQVYENRRAVDYLLTRPEVDGERVGITGASGGGNQSMYAGAWDDRLRAVVPVCSVGNYRAYLGAACCMCEVLPGALRFTDEWGVLGLTAPRALMVVSATRDAPQFSVGESDKSLALVEPIYRLYDRPGHVRHAVFESGHDYSRPMREAMYGWMALHLKGEGDGSPIPEPEIKTEGPETLRCYPGETRPDDFMTIPRFASAEARKLVAAKSGAIDAQGWREESEKRRKALVETVFGGPPQAGPPGIGAAIQRHLNAHYIIYVFHDDTGLVVTATSRGLAKGAPVAILLDGEDDVKVPGSEFLSGGWRVFTVRLRAKDSPNDDIAAARGHNSAEWAMWIGRPMLGQWVNDVRRVLDTIESEEGSMPREVVLMGTGCSGLVAICTAAVDKRVTQVAAIGTLASYVSDKPYGGQNLGVMAPGILRDAGDVAQIAALIAPRRLVVAGGVSGAGDVLSSEQLREAYGDATRVWELLGAGKELTLIEKADAGEVVKALAR